MVKEGMEVVSEKITSQMYNIETKILSNNNYNNNNKYYYYYSCNNIL